jgi:hypothetical protein
LTPTPTETPEPVNLTLTAPSSVAVTGGAAAPWTNIAGVVIGGVSAGDTVTVTLSIAGVDPSNNAGQMRITGIGGFTETTAPQTFTTTLTDANDRLSRLEYRRGQPGTARMTITVVHGSGQSRTVQIESYYQCAITAFRTAFQEVCVVSADNPSNPPADRQTPAGPSPSSSDQAPHIVVLDAQGNPVQTLALTHTGITVGRLANNALRLDDPVVSRNHARIDWDGARATVTDLGSKSGARLGTMRLPPQTPQVWDPAQTLQIGPYTLRLHIGAPSPADPAPPVTGDLHAAPTQKVREAGLSVALSPAHTALTLIPGEPADVEVRVTNQTNAPQTVALSLSGLPETWVEPAPALRVAPFSMKTAIIRVQAPASPESVVRPYEVRLRAASQEDPASSAELRLEWRVAPFLAGEVEVAPHRVQGREQAVVTVHLRNGGNVRATYHLRTGDMAQMVSAAFTQEYVTLDPDEIVEIPLTITAPRRIFGGHRVYTAPIEVEETDEVSGSLRRTLHAEVHFVQTTLLPLWAPVALFGLLLLLYGLEPPGGALGARSRKRFSGGGAERRHSRRSHAGCRACNPTGASGADGSRRSGSGAGCDPIGSGGAANRTTGECPDGACRGVSGDRHIPGGGADCGIAGAGGDRRSARCATGANRRGANVISNTAAEQAPTTSAPTSSRAPDERRHLRAHVHAAPDRHALLHRRQPVSAADHRRGQPALRSNLRSIAFGSIKKGTAGAPRTLLLKNTGNAPLTINEIAIGGVNAADFARVSGGADNCGASLAAGASCTITLTFTPAAAGQRTGQLRIETSSAGGVLLVSLSGAGTEIPEVASIVRIGNSPTNAASVQFQVNFSEPVKGVTARISAW